MKHIIQFLLLPLAVAASVSCIRDEAPNAEADILTCEVPDSILAGGVVVDNYSVRIRAKANADISHIAPVFTITEGATISPASGSIQNFADAPDNIIFYTVTSADKQWSKRYPVRIIQNEIPSEYKFNGVTLDPSGHYYVFNELDAAGAQVMTWASGNPGFYIANGNADADDYPTTPVRDNILGNYVKLETRATGSFGQLVGMPIAAGNIFQGFFDTSIAVGNPRGATKFGETYFYAPISFEGKYRYRAGEVYTDENNEIVPGEKDMFSLYALFYEVEDDSQYLDGSIHEANFEHPSLISIAMLDNPHESDEWIEFSIPFVMKPGKTIEQDKLIQGKYKLGIVISSSVDGDYFRGAVGSTLYVADLKINHQ